MSKLVDKNDRPISNGQNRPQETQDVRTLPTGTLIFNLIRYAGEEIGIENMIHQLEQVKVQQKMVADPPQLGALRAHHEALTNGRYVIAKELNDRFESVDKMRLAQLGIEIVTPSAAAEDKPKEV